MYPLMNVNLPIIITLCKLSSLCVNLSIIACHGNKAKTCKPSPRTYNLFGGFSQPSLHMGGLWHCFTKYMTCIPLIMTNALQNLSFPPWRWFIGHINMYIKYVPNQLKMVQVSLYPIKTINYLEPLDLKTSGLQDHLLLDRLHCARQP